MSIHRGTLFWSPRQVRVQLNGRLFDLGPRSRASAEIVAAEFDLALVFYDDVRTFPKRAPACDVVRLQGLRPARLLMPCPG